MLLLTVSNRGEDENDINSMDTQKESKNEEEQLEETLKDKKKWIRKVKWPDKHQFVTMDEFLRAIRNRGNKLIERGYPEILVADSLDEHIMTTEQAQQYLNTAGEHDLGTVEGILKALEETDINNEENSKEEKFEKLRMDKDEEPYSFMKRLRKTYEEIWGNSNGDKKKKETEIRRIRRAFFKGADVPEEISNDLRICENLSKIASLTQEDLKKRAEGCQTHPQGLPQQEQCCEPPNYHPNPPRPPKPNWHYQPPYFHQTQPTYQHNWGQTPFPIQWRENHLSHWQQNRMPFRQWDQPQQQQQWDHWQTRPQFQQGRWREQQQWDHWQQKGIGSL